MRLHSGRLRATRCAAGGEQLLDAVLGHLAGQRLRVPMASWSSGRHTGEVLAETGCNAQAGHELL